MLRSLSTSVLLGFIIYYSCLVRPTDQAMTGTEERLYSRSTGKMWTRALTVVSVGRNGGGNGGRGTGAGSVSLDDFRGPLRTRAAWLPGTCLRGVRAQQWRLWRVWALDELVCM